MMHEIEARWIAEQMLEQHLGGRGWLIRFDYAKTRAGVCKHNQKVISLSRYFIASATEAEVRQVMLHEIAHALVGAKHGHDGVWLQVARGIGYTGSRLISVDFKGVTPNWIGTCPSGHTIERLRKPSKTVSCGRCSRGFSAEHTITWRRAA